MQKLWVKIFLKACNSLTFSDVLLFISYYPNS